MHPWLQNVFLVPLSIFVWSVAFVSMALMVIASVLLLPVLPFRKTHVWIARPAMVMCIWCSFSRFRIIYHPDYDPTQPSVYSGNHVSSLDAHMLCRVIPIPFCALAAAKSFNVPIYGWIMKLSQSIPVHPRKSGRTGEIIEAAKDRAAQGISIGAYAEGGRTRDGKVGPFRRGVFFMARDAGIPIVPVISRGMYRLLRKGTWLIRPSTITVYVGKQIDISHLTDDEIGTFTEEFRQLVIDFAEDGKLPEGITSPWPI